MVAFWEKIFAKDGLRNSINIRLKVASSKSLLSSFLFCIVTFEKLSKLLISSGKHDIREIRSESKLRGGPKSYLADYATRPPSGIVSNLIYPGHATG